MGFHIYLPKSEVGLLVSVENPVQRKLSDAILNRQAIENMPLRRQFYLEREKPLCRSQ